MNSLKLLLLQTVQLPGLEVVRQVPLYPSQQLLTILKPFIVLSNLPIWREQNIMKPSPSQKYGWFGDTDTRWHSYHQPRQYTFGFTIDYTNCLFQGLEYDTQYNGHRLTIPTTLFPRYGYFNAVNEAPHSSKHSLFIKVTCEELEFQSNKEFDSDFICLSHNDAVIDENIVRYSTQENVTDLKDFVLIIKPKDVQRPDLIAIHDTLDPPLSWTPIIIYNRGPRQKPEEQTSQY